MDSGHDDGHMTARPGAMVKPLVILLIIVAILMGGIFAWQQFVAKKIVGPILKNMATAPQTVSTIVAAESSWQTQTGALGSVRAVRGADLSAQASGVIDTIHIESGTEVKAGTVLLTLKPQAELATITLKRDQEQLAAQAISQATVDTDSSNLKSARAQVVAQKALIEEKNVRAPFTGSLGIRQVDEGQYLSAGTTVVTLQALDPIFVDFYVPQGALSQLQPGQSVSATVDAYPGVTFKGKISSINSKVDSASRNVQARGSFANPGRKLIPGMYANVQVEYGGATKQVTLPQSAITYNPYGDTVYVLQKNASALTAQQRFVKLGETRGDQVAVLDGVKAGDEIVTAGQLKLHNGSAVKVSNDVTPTNEPSPTPPNE